MRMNKVLLTITALFCTTVLFAQNFSGVVLEKDGKTPIVGVSVSLVTSNGMSPETYRENTRDSRGQALKTS